MANALYNPAREGLLAAEIDIDTAVIKCALVRGYTFSATHKFVSDVTGASGVLHATSGALANKSITSGAFDADDITLPGVTANASNHSLLLFQASAVTGGADVAASAQRLIGWYDSGTGFPIVPDGNSVIIQWAAGANKIFALT